jgi:flagellar biosynthesis/type III secretory pathway M-ring protein FliF/YscJ
MRKKTFYAILIGLTLFVVTSSMEQNAKKNFFMSLIGLEKHLVLQELEKRNISYRILSEDDSYYMMTMDYQENRMNLRFRQNLLIAIE